MFQTRREKLVSRMQRQHVDIAILVPVLNMHYFTGLHLKQSERLTFAVITATNDLYFLLPQVELNKVDLSNGGVILSYSDEEGTYTGDSATKKGNGNIADHWCRI
ncbi:aminopeptidase P family N-terminal domain-containing protein [Lysinibacillus fusiformis]